MKIKKNNKFNLAILHSEKLTIFVIIFHTLELDK